MEYIVVGLFGLCLGSFFSVFVSRLERKDGIVAGRSECPKCGHILAWYDLVPLASFLFLAGKCRYCKALIPWFYPAIEVGTASLTILFLRQYGVVLSLREVVFLTAMLGFWLLLLFDIRYLILPDKIIFPMLGLSFVAHIFLEPGMWINYLLTGLLTALIFDIIYVVSAGRGMGFGDVKLALLVGFFFGYPLALIIMVTAIWLATFTGLGLIIARKATLKTALPFGAFLSVVAIGAILTYNDILIFRITFF